MNDANISAEQDLSNDPVLLPLLYLPIAGAMLKQASFIEIIDQGVLPTNLMLKIKSHCAKCHRNWESFQ